MSGMPRRARGRLSADAEAAYQCEVRTFCDRILEIKSSLDFEVGSRGWCYLLETEGVITKGEFDDAEKLISRCRKDGSLPIDICAEDGKRAAEGIEDLDDPDIDAAAAEFALEYANSYAGYTPFSFWDDLDVYVEIATEKSDLKSLFANVAKRFRIVIQNIGGWADIRGRAGMMRRFQQWEARGKKCVLLYCGDHDPGGLHISDYLYANLDELAGAVGWSPVNLLIKRFGLDCDFIEENKLTWIENLETSSGGNLADPKHHDHNKPYVQGYIKRFAARKVEANALVARPEAGRELCRQAILQYVPEAAVEAYEARLRKAREELKATIEARL